MNTHTEYLAKSVQLQRRTYWAHVSDGNETRARLAARGLAVSERMLIASVGGSVQAARRAEVAYINSQYAN